MVDFDDVIVGAGAAGCVLASRLSEDPGSQVLPLEYGGSDTNPLLCVPTRAQAVPDIFEWAADASGSTRFQTGASLDGKGETSP